MLILVAVQAINVPQKLNWAAGRENLGGYGEEVGGWVTMGAHAGGYACAWTPIMKTD